MTDKPLVTSAIISERSAVVVVLGVGMGVGENVTVRVDVKVTVGATFGYAGAVQPPLPAACSAQVIP
jgi:hypothetical protein